jgi:hypothetical protein
MPRKPNYQFERKERERLKASKIAAKADEKRELRERARMAAAGDVAGDVAADAEGAPDDEAGEA